MSLGKKSFFSPFRFWSNTVKSPTTVRFPKEEIDTFGKPGASPNYRGLHSNDMEKCIGCGTCEEICPTDAVTMIEGDNTGEGKLGKRPVIDYGRCCFCAFCVDICPSGSLAMSREYIRTYRTKPEILGDEEVEDIRRHFLFLPGDLYKDNKGHTTEDEESWLDLERTKMAELLPEDRHDSFVEIVKGFTKEQALKEASRCIECGVCTETCPANMNIPEYIRAIWDEDLEESVRQMYMDNPLPGVCGRVCTHKCETVCALVHRGEPIAIRWLKRYAVDGLDEPSIKKVSASFREADKKKKVGIIGSGPAGLSAAYYLSLLGYDITIYEGKEKAGGVMRYGIPKYRLPDDTLDRDIKMIRALGVLIETGKEVGVEISFDKVRKESDAVFLATGFSRPMSTNVEGIDKKGCFQAIDLLSKLAAGEAFVFGREVVIIGGGNVAFDIARSLSRLQRKKYGEVHITITCLEKEDEMLADEEEIVQGREEGIVIKTARYPKKVEYDGKKLKGLATVRCVSIFDDNNKFNPTTDETNREFYPGDMVIEAIGQRPDYSFLGGDIEKKLDIVRGRIVTDEEGATDIPGLFAGGDIVHGPDVIHAIADGHRSAQAIDRFLTEK